MKPEPETGESPDRETEAEAENKTMAAPRAASARDVREAEESAEEAKRMAVEETEKVRQELREEVEELREENERLRNFVRQLDSLVHAAYRHVDGLNGERSHVVPENRSGATLEVIDDD